jgi:hypothetical protein
MDVHLISEVIVTAKKVHECMASEFICNYGINGYGYSFAELRVIAKAKKNGYKILAGQGYLRQACKLDGEIYTFRAIPEMHKICLKHDHYES